MLSLEKNIDATLEVNNGQSKFAVMPEYEKEGITGFRGTEPIPEHVLFCEDKTWISEQIDQLPESLSRVLIMWWWCGYRVEKIAEILGCSRQTVYNNLERVKCILGENESMIDLFNQLACNRNTP